MGIFVFLLLITLFLFIWGLIAPHKLAKIVSKRSQRTPTRKHFGLGFGTATIVLFILVGVTAPKQPAPANQSIQLTTSKSAAQAVAPAPSIQEKISTQTKAIPFSSTTVQDASSPQGTSKITTAGINGVETLTYKDTYVNGKQTNHQLVSDTVTTQPITQVTSVGTYVAPVIAPAPAPTPSCTNGTYVNSAGNTVCSPETSPTVPAGATAQCVDGTYSFSQSRRGTCSYHGGVAQWL